LTDPTSATAWRLLAEISMVTEPPTRRSPRGRTGRRSASHHRSPLRPVTASRVVPPGTGPDRRSRSAGGPPQAEEGHGQREREEPGWRGWPISVGGRHRGVPGRGTLHGRGSSGRPGCGDGAGAAGGRAPTVGQPERRRRAQAGSSAGKGDRPGRGRPRPAGPPAGRPWLRSRSRPGPPPAGRPIGRPREPSSANNRRRHRRRSGAARRRRAAPTASTRNDPSCSLLLGGRNKPGRHSKERSAPTSGALLRPTGGHLPGEGTLDKSDPAADAFMTATMNDAPSSVWARPWKPSAPVTGSPLTSLAPR
jgi:hypothetical protein